MHRRSIASLVVAVLAGCWSHAAPTAGSATIPSTSAVPQVRSRNGYETASILALIEQRFGLKPLAKRDKRASPFTNAFDFSQK
jgi:hypothetical protein